LIVGKKKALRQMKRGPARETIKKTGMGKNGQGGRKVRTKGNRGKVGVFQNSRRPPGEENGRKGNPGKEIKKKKIRRGIGGKKVREQKSFQMNASGQEKGTLGKRH